MFRFILPIFLMVGCATPDQAECFDLLILKKDNRFQGDWEEFIQGAKLWNGVGAHIWEWPKATQGRTITVTSWVNVEATKQNICGVYFAEVYGNPDVIWINPDWRELNCSMVNVAAHEVGHAIGLDHIWDHESIMNSYLTNVERLSVRDVLLACNVLGLCGADTGVCSPDSVVY